MVVQFFTLVVGFPLFFQQYDFSRLYLILLILFSKFFPAPSYVTQNLKEILQDPHSSNFDGICSFTIMVPIYIYIFFKFSFTIPFLFIVLTLYGNNIAHLRTGSYYILLDLPFHQICCQSERNCDLCRDNPHVHTHTNIHIHEYTCIQKIFQAARLIEKYYSQPCIITFRLEMGHQNLFFKDMLYFLTTSQQRRKAQNIKVVNKNRERN